MLGLIDSQQDERLTGDIGQAYRRALAQRMVARQPQPSLGVEQCLRDNVGVGEVGGEHDRHVETSLQQTLLDGAALLLVQLQGHIGVPVFQTLQMVWQEVADHRIACRQAQQAAGAHVRQRAVQRVVNTAQDHVGAVQEVAAGLGQAHALGRALEQHHAKHGFQFLDRRSHRRLRDVQVDGCLGNLADLGGGNEVADLTQGQ